MIEEHDNPFLDLDTLVLVCCKPYHLIWNHSIQPACQERQFDVAFSLQYTLCGCNRLYL